MNKTPLKSLLSKLNYILGHNIFYSPNMLCPFFQLPPSFILKGYLELKLFLIVTVILTCET